jgi:hypothetical protein
MGLQLHAVLADHVKAFLTGWRGEPFARSHVVCPQSVIPSNGSNPVSYSLAMVRAAGCNLAFTHTTGSRAPRHGIQAEALLRWLTLAGLDHHIDLIVGGHTHDADTAAGPTGVIAVTTPSSTGTTKHALHHGFNDARERERRSCGLWLDVPPRGAPTITFPSVRGVEDDFRELNRVLQRLGVLSESDGGITGYLAKKQKEISNGQRYASSRLYN